MHLYRAFHAQRSFLAAGHKQTGLGSGQPKLLAYIDMHGSCTQRELAAYYDVGPATVCRMLDSLERSGFIQSAPDARDRRTKHLRITAAGRHALSGWEARCEELRERMLADFTPEEQRQFSALLVRAYLNMRDAGKAAAPAVAPAAASARAADRAPHPAPHPTPDHTPTKEAHHA